MSEACKCPRIMFVSTGSGSGKTTVTCGILQALINRKLAVASFKCGPDYIDPMFHSKVLGAKSRNLDIVMCGEDTVKFLLAKSAQNCDLSVMEGVMGMYDGVGFDSDFGSSNHLSQLTDTPQILIVNVRGMSLSAAALIGGFISYQQNNIKGILFDHCSKAMYPHYKAMVERELSLKVFGYFPFVPEASIESRHLGLVTANEIENIHQKLALLAKTAEECVDIHALITLGQAANPLTYQDLWRHITRKSSVKIAVAKDNAFCFFYQDNLDLLEECGAELVYFSPISDKELPKDIDGLLLFGGYPEEHVKELSQNKTMLSSVKKALDHKLPTFAECGGFMYLLENLIDKSGECHQMTGALKGTVTMTKSLRRFGYLSLRANEDNMLCKKGREITAHEFHYSNSDQNGKDFTASKRDNKWSCIHATDDLFAGYPHMHWGGNTDFAVNFIDKCIEFSKKRRGDDDIK